MTRSERSVIYPVLIILLVFNTLLLLGTPGKQAVAEGMAWFESLGPAESVTLTSEGTDDLVIRNRKGRLAWGEGDHQQAFSIGAVHISDVLRKLMDSDAMKDEREVLTDEVSDQDAEFMAQGQALDDKYGGIGPDDPQADEARREYTELRSAYERFRAESSTRMAQMAADQLESAYRELVDAANVVADRKGIDVVLRFIPTDDEFEVNEPEHAMNEIRFRTLLRYPDTIDLTLDVLEELSLDVD